VSEKFSTGVDGLDRITHGGFMRGSAYILQGPPGAGKTILANQFCFGHARGGGRVLYMSLLAENHERMLTHLSGMSFFDASVLPEGLQYISGYGVLEREGLSGLLKLVQHEIKRHQATAIVLDGIFVAQSNVSEAEFRKFVHELQGVANFADSVLVMLTHQNRDQGSPEHTMVDGWIEICDEIKGFRSYRTIQVKKHRGSAILAGKHHFRITDNGVQVFPKLEAINRELPSLRASMHQIPTGIHDLDSIISGGLTEGSSSLVIGPTGSGKTTFGLHFLAQATPEAPGLMVGFYETPARLVKKAKGIGLDFDAAVQSGAVHVMWRSASDNSVDELAWEILSWVKEKRVKRVFIDGLVALRDNLIVQERLPYVLNALKFEFAEMGATSLYTSEIRNMHSPDLLPTDDVSLIVDNVLLLTYLRRENALRRSLSVLKMRDNYFDPRAQEFHITSAGITFGMDPILTASEGG
jgi:circadian clock protein KaiC